MADLSHTDDQQFWILAVQTVLFQKKDSLSLDSYAIKEISDDVARKAKMFKQVTEEMDKELENKRKTWGMVLSTLSDEALLDSYQSAIRLMLEQEFIDLLISEIHKRGLKLPSISNVVSISSAN